LQGISYFDPTVSQPSSARREWSGHQRETADDNS
jgi:hypothetical protein